eukprot:UN22146
MECGEITNEKAGQVLGIVSLALSAYCFFADNIHGVIHKNQLLESRTDAKVKAFLVAEKSRSAAQLMTLLFNIFSVICAFYESSQVFGYLFVITFFLHSWFQSFYTYFKHDLVKFDKITAFSQAWYVLITHRFNLVLSVIDIILLKVDVEGSILKFDFRPYVHFPVYIISQLILLACTCLLLGEYIHLMTRHTGRRYVMHLSQVFWRNTTWGILFNLCII